jgi:hypothetical protein
LEWFVPIGVTYLICLAVTIGISIYAMHLATKALIEVKALNASTHNVHLVPADELAAGPDKEDEYLDRQVAKGDRLSWDSLRDISEPLS